MAKAKDDADRPGTVRATDDEQPQPVLAGLRDVLDRADGLPADAPADVRESAEADICLASRSAYFDFYTTIVLDGVIDDAVERELDHLFRRALATMQSGDFKSSVEKRYKEFRGKCERTRRGEGSSQLVSSVE